MVRSRVTSGICAALAVALAAGAAIASSPAETEAATETEIETETGTQAGLITQAAVRMGVDSYWSEGYLGQGQVVGILDEGFAGLDRSIALGELPPREDLVIASFDAEHGLDGETVIGLPTQHGVRMAELVWDIAPEAQLVLVNYHTQEDFARAARWLVSQGVHVINHSNSFLTPPFDGTGPAARVVDEVAGAGVLWVNSVGNYAQRHWAGVAHAGPIVIPIAPRAGEPLLLSLGWGNPASRASVTIERGDAGGGYEEVARSAPNGPLNAQTGLVIADGSPYRLVVRQESGPPTGLRLFSRTVGFGPLAVAEGSVPTPGDAAGSLSVGAVRWTGTALAPYSSRGPAASASGTGRLKPDVVAPTYVTSNPEWPGTAGTSASAAHVTGAAALLRQARIDRGQSVAVERLRAAVVNRALDLGDPGPDNSFGLGQVRLDRSAPVLRVGVRPGRRPVVQIRAVDRGTLREIRVLLDGEEIRTVRWPAFGVRLPELAPGQHDLRVEAEDMAGNVAVKLRGVRG